MKRANRGDLLFVYKTNVYGNTLNFIACNWPHVYDAHFGEMRSRKARCVVGKWVTNLEIGTGNDWAGHKSVSEWFIRRSIFENFWSGGNVGAFAPTGSVQNVRGIVNERWINRMAIYLFDGTGNACALQNRAIEWFDIRSIHERRTSFESRAGAFAPTGSKIDTFNRFYSHIWFSKGDTIFFCLPNVEIGFALTLMGWGGYELGANLKLGDGNPWAVQSRVTA